MSFFGCNKIKSGITKKMGCEKHKGVEVWESKKEKSVGQVQLKCKNNERLAWGME